MTSIEDMLKSGLALIPVLPSEKKPQYPNWNLKEGCVTSQSEHHRFDGMNVGIAHAFCSPTPTCALDIDNVKTARPWLASHGIDLINVCSQDDVVGILSGREHSLKLLYRLPTGTSALPTQQIKGFDGKCSIEFRCGTSTGKTVQDLIPPSVHPSGREYRWVTKTSPLQIPMLPTDILRLWEKLLSRECRVSERNFPQQLNDGRRPETPRRIAQIREALSFINADCEYQTWRNLVWSILSSHWSIAEQLAEEWSMRAPHRFDIDSFWTVVNSYNPDHSNPITFGTIYHHARLGGWSG